MKRARRTRQLLFLGQFRGKIQKCRYLKAGSGLFYIIEMGFFHKSEIELFYPRVHLYDPA